LSEATRGLYLRLDDPNDAVSKLKTQLESIEQKDLGDSAFIDYKSYFQWFLAAALLLLLIEMIVPETKLAKS
jgi:Ca-activated chloride channel family protein